MNNEKIKNLISAMTLEEKIGMLHGQGFFQTRGVKRLGIPPLKMSDGPMGVRQEFPMASWAAKGDNDDYVSYFPANTALAATWNPDLSYKLGNALGAETRSRGKDVILAPGINIIRSPFCGRNFEYMSEDPYLTKKMSGPVITGIQENDVAACVKHFIANNQETKRLEVDVQMDTRTMEEIYLPAFEEALTNADSFTVMTAYNKFNGSYCCENETLLKDLLRDRFNYKGIVVSDWGACHSTVESAKAGLDIEMSVTDDFDDYYFGNPLYEAVMTGKVDQGLIDEKIYRILTIMDRLHMLDKGDPTNSPIRKSGSRNTPDHHGAALDVARESIVLLKNNNRILPLNPQDFTSIAIVGDNGDKKHSTGGGSAEIKALYEHTPLAGISSYLGGNHKITYIKGYSSEKDAGPYVAFNLREEAKRLASNHDLVIFIGGLNHDHDTEGSDRSDYKLPYQQDQLVKELSQVCETLISVHISGSAVDLTDLTTYSDALIQSWYNGMEGGRALAEVLFGQVNPSGKLPFTFASDINDYAAHSIGEFPGSSTVSYSESIFVGYRHFDSHDIDPLYPFGYGLSYTNFAYSDLNLSLKDDYLEITFTIKNTGERSGKEVCQLYTSQIHPSEPRPHKELKGFVKIDLQPGYDQVIKTKIPLRDLGFYSEISRAWITEQDKYQIFIGSSSRDIHLSGEFAL